MQYLRLNALKEKAKKNEKKQLRSNLISKSFNKVKILSSCCLLNSVINQKKKTHIK